MRALIAIAALSSGCDQLFQIDQIGFSDGGAPIDTQAGSAADGAIDGAIDVNPRFEASGWTAYLGDGTLYTSVAVTLDGQIDRNSLVVVAICEFPMNVAMSVSDSLGSMYTHAAAADSEVTSPALAATLYYAVVPMPATALEVDVAFDPPGVESPDVRVAAYTNVAQFAPFEVASGNSMTNVDTLDASVIPTEVPALLVAATCVGGQSTTIDGFQVRAFSQPNGDMLGDALSDSISTEIATAHQNPASGMIVQLAAFHGSGPR